MATADRVEASRPVTVSVVIPVWNAAAYLRECLDSVVNQSIGLAALEVITVDDGSTDESPAILREYADRYPQFQVISQPNSGGPGRPRNVGLAQARGTYVFFLDADDYLGTEALQRLVAMAERNHSDIVLAKLVGVNGRPVPTAVFRRNRDRATVTQVYSSLTALKLFRLDLLRRLDLRFAEGLAGGEDAPFTAKAYFGAAAISVLADYDAYYTRFRQDSQSASGWKWGPELVGHLQRMGERLELVEQAVAPGPERDQLLTRHLADLARPFKAQWLRLDPDVRHSAFLEAARHVQRFASPQIQDRLPPWSAYRVYCLVHGLEAELRDIAAVRTMHACADPIIEGDRVFARYPHFRDGSGIPDRCFDITPLLKATFALQECVASRSELRLRGTGYLRLIGGATSLVLTDQDGAEVVYPTTPYPTPKLRERQAEYPLSGFTLSLDLAAEVRSGALRAGRWGMALRVGTARVERTAPLTPGLAPAGGALEEEGGRLWLRVGRRPLRLRSRARTAVKRIGRRLRAQRTT